MVDGRTRAALIALVVVACSQPARPPAPPEPELTRVELVETQPIETTLDTPLADAHVVWLHYFYESRNVGLAIADRDIASMIALWSDKTWWSSYATRVDPAAQYTAPRIE